MSKSARAKHRINLAELRWKRERAIAKGRPWQDAEQVYQESFAILAAAFVAPIRRVLNWEGIARSIFKVEPMPEKTGERVKQCLLA